MILRKKRFRSGSQLKQGVIRATKTLDRVQGAWIQDREVVVQDGKITEYKVRMKVTFVLKD